jgi:hypothetical protein
MRAQQHSKLGRKQGGVAEDAVDAGRRATRSVSRQIHENPLLAVLVGFALGYVAGSWIRGGDRPGRTALDLSCDLSKTAAAAMKN